MSRSRQRVADFEARSVQIIAACTLGLAGVASLPNATLSRITGQTSTHSTAPAKLGHTETPRLVQRRPGT